MIPGKRVLLGLGPNVRGDRRRVVQHFVEGLCPPQPLRPSLLSTDEHAPESQKKARRRSGVQVLWFGLVTAAAEASKTQRQQQELAILRATLGLIILV